MTCRAVHDVALDMYRNLANGLLRQYRALPLKGFQRLMDLTTLQLIRSIDKATCYESDDGTRAHRDLSKVARIAPNPIRLEGPR